MKTGLAHAADLIRAEAESEDDIDLATLCEYVATSHRPGRDMRCLECGELWHTAEQFPNLGGLRCQMYADVVVLKNEWIIGRVARIRDRWAA
ncbi:hypothetical protein SEA_LITNINMCQUEEN_94 [Gordonia phage LitninMcQueen]